MNVTERIDIFTQWGVAINAAPELAETIHTAYLHNKWFTEDNIQYMVDTITKHFLNKELLEKWLAKYPAKEDLTDTTVGIVMAGNVPLVGFHDLLCVLAAGHKVQVKQSSKDEIMLPFLVKILGTVSKEMASRIEIVEKLAKFDAVIATGGNNTGRYFELYFGKYPHIIRRNRNSIAILKGDETRTELMKLGDDIFRYFGLGCRNVSKLYIPREYDLTILLDALEPFNTVMLHDKYKNNYDYQRTLLLLNNTVHLASDFLSIREKEHVSSAISTLNYEYYDSVEEVEKHLTTIENDIQVVVSKLSIKSALPYGQSQEPELWDYADKVDTMQFLVGLN